MVGARVVDSDIRRAAQARVEHGFILDAEELKPRRQQTHHLPLRNHNAHACQKRQYPLAGHLAREVKHQHQPMQIGTVGSCRQYPARVRR